MSTPVRCPARAPVRGSFRIPRREVRPCHGRRAWTTTAEAASAAWSSAPDDDVIRAPPGSRIYFAYGSNVNTKTMNGTRGIKPSAAYPAILPGYKLVFNVPGLPFIEPAFASVRRVVGAEKGIARHETETEFARFETETHGVAYVVTDEQWRYLLRTETSYVCEDVTCVRFVHDDDDDDDDDDNDDDASRATEKKKIRIAATTLVFPDVDVGGVQLLPSARYLNVLREGAMEWNLDQTWRRYLAKALKSYDPEISASRTLGAAVAAVSLAPIAAFSAPVSAAVAAKSAFDKMNGEETATADDVVEAALGGGFRAFSQVAWGVHNALWAPVFGSGANNDRRPPRRETRRARG